MEKWESNYLLIAPVDGKVSFASLIQEKQNVSTGQEVFYLSPQQSLPFGEVHIPQLSLGKIKEGQRVIIKFDSYPYQEFGCLEGKVL